MNMVRTIIQVVEKNNSLRQAAHTRTNVLLALQKSAMKGVARVLAQGPNNSPAIPNNRSLASQLNSD